MKYFIKLRMFFYSFVLTTILSFQPGFSTKPELTSDTVVQQAKNIVVSASQGAVLFEDSLLLNLGDTLPYVFVYFDVADLRNCALSCKMLQSHSYNAPMYTELLIKSNLCEKDGKRFKQDSGKRKRDIFWTAVDNNDVLARIALADFYRDGNYIRPDSTRERNALNFGTTSEEQQTALKKIWEENKNLFWKSTLRFFTIQEMTKEDAANRVSVLSKFQPGLDSETRMDPSDKIRFKILFYKHTDKDANNWNFMWQYHPDKFRNDPAIYPEDRTTIDLQSAKLEDEDHDKAFELFTQVSQDPTAWCVHRIEADYQRALMGAKGLVTSLSVPDILNLIKKVRNSGFKGYEKLDRRLEIWEKRKTGKLSSKKPDEPPSPSEEEIALLEIGHNIFKERKTNLSSLELKALDCVLKYGPKIDIIGEPKDPDFADSSEDEVSPPAFEDEETPSQSDEEDTPQ